MRHEVTEIGPAGLRTAVGSAAYTRGVECARRHAVVQALWDPRSSTLRGTVHGRRGGFYRTTAYFTAAGETPRFVTGDCSCDVGSDCKHVVALVLTASGADRPPESDWRRSIDSLFERPAGRGPARTPLAIELSLSGPASLRGSVTGLSARVVQPGRSGWVAGGLSWSGLADLRFRHEFSEEQVRALRELYAVYTLRNPSQYHYGYREEKSIELTAYESVQLWPLLDQAVAAGVRFVHPRKGLGDVPVADVGELCLDVTTTGGALSIRPTLRADGSELGAAPVAFIGADGHGLICVEGDQALRLIRLTKPVPARLQRLALDRRGMEVPAADEERFSKEYYPRLRQLATVTSSDDSFTPPSISPPTLVLRAAYGDGHELVLGWDWRYDVGTTRLRFPLYADTDTGYRDLEAERRLLDGLDAGLERFGLWRPGTAQPLAPQARLGGLDTMRFSTEVLPLLDGLPGVCVEIEGDAADYREAGSSVRIGVSTDAVDGQTDWFDLGVTITVEGRTVPFVEVFTALSRGESHLLLGDGAYFSLDKPELQALRRLIDEARALQDRPDGPLRISRFQAGLWSELAELGEVDRQAQAWQRQVDGLLDLGSMGERTEPAGLAARLRPYQADGYRWLAFLHEHGLGGVLADDMGLGKTLQTLAMICAARRDDPGAAPFLIVAPTSVVANWRTEAARFTPGLTVMCIGDTVRKRGQHLADVIAGADVVVTSYTLFRLDFEHYSAQGWSGLVLDEAQFVKNHQAKTYQCARRLAAPFKLAITGTPMENSLMELWSLLSITAPGLFPSPAKFREYYAQPIEKGDPELLAQLRRRVKPLLRRRTKEQVAADLPVKQEQVLEVELHPRHRTIYQRHLQRVRQEVLGLIDDLDRNRFAILRSLTLLRQLSLHAGLVDDAHRDLPSGKVDVLVEQLADVVAGGHRALVFSQFTGFLDVVRRRLDAEGVEYCYLDGRTRRRDTVVDRFKHGSAPVFLISLKAGGFGLNLTEADYCFVLDPWWNPATEAQAVDRTHRIGQTRNVMVYRLIAAGTIEEKVMALKQRKAELFASVIDEGNAFGSTLDAEDIRELFT